LQQMHTSVHVNMRAVHTQNSNLSISEVKNVKRKQENGTQNNIGIRYVTVDFRKSHS